MNKALYILAASVMVLAVVFYFLEQRSGESGEAGTQVRLEPDSSVQTLPEADLSRQREYIERVFPQLTQWDIESIRSELSPEISNNVMETEIADVLMVLGTQLGQLERFEIPVVTQASQADIPVPDGSDTETQYYRYEYMAYFEQGVALVNLVLEEGSQGYKLYSFNFDIPDATTE